MTLWKEAADVHADGIRAGSLPKYHCLLQSFLKQDFFV
jgi:hypothetical protein